MGYALNCLADGPARLTGYNPKPRILRKHYAGATMRNFNIMGNNINLTDDEWQTIYTSVHREYERQLREKILDDTSSKRWLELLLKILAHIDCDELDKKSRN